jgi:hypothetical protein
VTNPSDLQAEIVWLRNALQYCQSRTRLALASLERIRALLLGLQRSPVPVGELAALIGETNACRAQLMVTEEASHG